MAIFSPLTCPECCRFPETKKFENYFLPLVLGSAQLSLSFYTPDNWEQPLGPVIFGLSFIFYDLEQNHLNTIVGI